MRTLAILSSCLFFIAGTARGQSVLTGYVYNTDKDPLESVTVALLNSTDSTLVVSTLTDSLGRYELTGVFKGEILQYIYHSGYSDYYRTISATSQSFLPDIFLYRNEYDIKDIVVSTKRFEQSSDRFIYNVAGSKLTEGGDAMTIFRNTPLLNVDEYERISILGKGGVQYQINGRRLRLSGEALTNYIKAIPAEDIVRLEIITSPGSAYQSEGNYGIINIVTSKNIPPGFKGRISFTDAQNKFRNNQDGNMSFTYNRGKFLISATGYSGYNYFVMESQSTYDFK